MKIQVHTFSITAVLQQAMDRLQKLESDGLSFLMATPKEHQRQTQALCLLLPQ